ncbi:MAG: hypothetical protein EPO36_02495 [Chloroflexota bacterium]|nr:MAG: hypothetical protein EPO36_02495 [Chloroflexota bacterium]
MTLGLLVAFVVATCGSPAGTQFRTELPNAGYDPLPLVLYDETGLVIGIEPAEPNPDAGLNAVVEADPGDPDAFIVSWFGGLCDEVAELFLRPSESTLFLHLEVPQGTNCPAMAVRRALRIRTSSPIPEESIVVTGGG